jgi:hypothetical protein
MNINFDRICKLAGVSSSSGGGLINEAASYDEGYEDKNEAAFDPDMMEEEEAEEEEEVAEEDLDDADEMVEVDIHELMSEIRRAKNIMAVNEQKKRNIALRKKKLQENHLKRIIQQEVNNVLADIEERDSSWVYGSKKPRHSRKGYTNQGRTLPGIGFSKKW